jgi:hypothetical protein
MENLKRGIGMDTKALLIELTRRGVTLRILDGRIECIAPQNAFSPELKFELDRHAPEIQSLYSGVQISDSLHLIAELWEADVSSRGVGDAAWAWIKGTDHWQIIEAAEAEWDRIGKAGDPDELNAACSTWIRAWARAIKDFLHSTDANHQKNKSQIAFEY